MLWEAVAVEIVFSDEGVAAEWFHRPRDPSTEEESLKRWDWHGLFHDELADGQGAELPASASPRAAIEWIATRAAASNSSELIVPPRWEGGVLSLAMSFDAEPTVDEPILACMLVSAASEVGASSQLLMLGGHDPYNLYGYPDDYTHLLIRQPENTETAIACEAFEELMTTLWSGKLDAAFAMAAANPLGDDD